MTTLLVGRKEIVVDAEDLKIIADYYLHVNPNGYVQCTVRGYANRGKNAYLHRIILGVNGKDKEVDHRLADVLLAIQARDKATEKCIADEYKQHHVVSTHYVSFLEVLKRDSAFWNLAADVLTFQSDETLLFIYNLLQ